MSNVKDRFKEGNIVRFSGGKTPLEVIRMYENTLTAAYCSDKFSKYRSIIVRRCIDDFTLITNPYEELFSDWYERLSKQQFEQLMKQSWGPKDSDAILMMNVQSVHDKLTIDDKDLDISKLYPVVVKVFEDYESVKVYRYVECGLDNVFIEGLSETFDENGDLIVEMPAINELHKLIATRIVSRKKKIGPAEIRFLRTEMGLTQAEFAKIVFVHERTVRRWELSETSIGDIVEEVIRELAIKRLDLKVEELSSDDLEIIVISSDELSGMEGSVV